MAPADLQPTLADLLRPHLYVIDEPERHLHPRLQRAAAAWLAELCATRAAQAVIATHAAAFLQAAPGVRLVYLHRTTEACAYAPVTDEALAATGQIAAEMGLDRGELLAGGGPVLYVEGETDRRIIETLMRDELRSARIMIGVFGGVGNITSLLDDPLQRYTTAPIAVLVDNVSREQIAELKRDARARAPIRARATKRSDSRTCSIELRSGSVRWSR
jgi:hypothetical protein